MDYYDDDELRPFDKAYVLEQIAADRAEQERKNAEHEACVADCRAKQSCAPAQPQPQPHEKTPPRAKAARSPTMNSDEWAAWIRAAVKAEVARAMEKLKGEVADAIGKTIV